MNPPSTTAPTAAVRELLRTGSMPASIRQALERALAANSGPVLDLSFLEALGPAGARVKAALTAVPPAQQTVISAPGESTSVTTHANVSPADSLFVQRAARPSLPLVDDPGTRPDPDTSGLLRDPNTVMSSVNAISGALSVRSIVLTRQGAPRTAELAAETLAGLYGPFTAQGNAADRAAVIETLQWVCGIGIQYDFARSEVSSPETQAPNKTLSTASGVCRDIHAAGAALLASLMNAQPDGQGKWKAGPPDGQEENVQCIGFNNPSEYHAYIVYRDPATGRWNALEYDKHYAMQAENAVDAFRTLPGFISGYIRYAIAGWDGLPYVANMGSVGAARSNEFMTANPGQGLPGELRVKGSKTELGATAFLTKNLSLSAAIDPSALGNGLRGGLKFNSHSDFENADTRGYLRIAGGVTSDYFDASTTTGRRSASARARYQTYVLALKVDGRIEGKERALLGDHLRASWGVDLDGLGGLPLSQGGGLDGFVVPVGAITDYSHLKVGVEGALSGHEQLSPTLALDWAVRLRYQSDLVQTAVELITSQGTRAAQGLLRDAPRAEFAVALTQKIGTVTTRIEAGGTQQLGAPYDPQTTPQELHHAILSVDAGVVNFGLIARGQTIDRRFIPVNGLAVALNVNPTPNISVGVTAQSVFPDGDIRTIGQNVQVAGNLTIKF